MLLVLDACWRPRIGKVANMNSLQESTFKFSRWFDTLSSCGTGHISVTV